MTGPSLFAWLPIIDTAVAMLWFILVLTSWRGYTPPPEGDNTEERALGATIILGQLNATVTGAAIVIAGIGAFVAIGHDAVGVATWHLIYGAAWAILALALTLHTMSRLPTLTPKLNVVRSRGVALGCAMALLFVVVAGFRFMLGIIWVLVWGATSPVEALGLV